MASHADPRHCNHAHNDDEKAHFHADLNNIMPHVLAGKDNFTKEEAKVMASPHNPEVFLICCIDSRIQPNKALDYGPGVTLEYRPIAAVVPPPAEADTDLDSRMAFRRLKDIANIIIVCHSDCGGAQAAIAVPDPDLKNGGDLDIVASSLQRSGLDIPDLSRKFMAASGGDSRAAGDRLAKAVGVQSLKNVLQYKGRDGSATIGDEVRQGKANVLLLFYNLEERSFEQYNAKAGKWAALGQKDSAPAKAKTGKTPKDQGHYPPPAA
jgi:carbonic anhydrase